MSKKTRLGVSLEKQSVKILAILQKLNTKLDTVSGAINFAIQEYAKTNPKIDLDTEEEFELKRNEAKNLKHSIKNKYGLNKKPKVLSKRELEAKALENAILKIDRENRRKQKKRANEIKTKNLGCSFEEYLYGD